MSSFDALSIKSRKVLVNPPKSHKLSRLLSPATMSTLKLLSSINIYVFSSLIVWNVRGFFLIKKSEIWWWWPLSIIIIHSHSHADEVYFYFSACAYCSSPAAPQRQPLFEPWWSFSLSCYENSHIRCPCDWNLLLRTLILRLNEKCRLLFNVTEIWCHLLILFDVSLCIYHIVIDSFCERLTF